MFKKSIHFESPIWMSGDPGPYGYGLDINIVNIIGTRLYRDIEDFFNFNEDVDLDFLIPLIKETLLKTWPDYREDFDDNEPYYDWLHDVHRDMSNETGLYKKILSKAIQEVKLKIYREKGYIESRPDLLDEYKKKYNSQSIESGMLVFKNITQLSQQEKDGITSLWKQSGIQHVVSILTMLQSLELLLPGEQLKNLVEVLGHRLQSSVENGNIADAGFIANIKNLINVIGEQITNPAAKEIIDEIAYIADELTSDVFIPDEL